MLGFRNGESVIVEGRVLQGLRLGWDGRRVEGLRRVLAIEAVAPGGSGHIWA